MLWLTLGAALLPSVLLIAFFYQRDRRPEPHHVLLGTFFLGVVTVGPVLAIGLPLLFAMPNFSEWGLSPLHSAMAHALWMAFLCAAIPEEVCKYAVLMGYSARHKAFNEPMDGVIYGAVASLGFATLENIMYVHTGGWIVAIMRALTAVPMHAFVGAVLGYYVGQARFNQASQLSAIRGLLMAILVHGIYNFGLMAVAKMALDGSFDNDDGTTLLWALGLIAVSFFVLVAAGIQTLIVVQRLNAQQHREISTQLSAPPGEQFP